MKRIQAAVIPAPGERVQVRDFDEPFLEKGAALLKVEFSEVCGTDVYLQQGRLGGVPYPLIPGHVSVGCLAKIHGPLADLHGVPFREGDRITFLDVHGTCNNCWHCLVAKSTTRCPNRKVYGITYGTQDGLCGGWSEYLHLKPGTKCISMGDADSRVFMAGGCSLPTALHAMDRAEIGVGQAVLVLGSGPVGLACMILAGLSGASKVLAVGAPARRLEIARSLGASVIDFEQTTEEERRDWVLEMTGGRGADITIEATGSPIAVVQGMRWTRDAGRVVVVGQYTDHGEIPFNPHLDLNRKHLEVRGCWGSDFSHFYRAVQLIQEGTTAARWAQIPLAEYPLTRCQDAIDSVARGNVVKALIVPGAEG